LILSKAERAAANADDARRSATDHFQKRTRSQTKLFEPPHVFNRPDHFANLCDVSGAKHIKREQGGQWNLQTTVTRLPS
jgi:hypothetical protein